MNARTKLALGGTATALLIAGAVAAPEVGGLFLFVAGFTAVMLWVLGFTRTPAFVRARRKAAGDGLAPLAAAHAGVPERVFRVRINRWAIAFCYLVGLFPLALGLLTLAAAVSHPKERSTLIVLGVAITAFGTFFTYYAWRIGRMEVRIGPRGIDGDLLFGSRQIAWDDIVAVAQKTTKMYGQPVIVDHAVYSRDGEIILAAKLENRDELLAIVLAHALQVDDAK
jgi:hypothetical protein